MAKQVLANKRESIRSRKIFGIMADEYTDLSSKEILSMCFQWIKDLRAHEDFVGYSEWHWQTSDTIVTAINDSLIRIQLSLNDIWAQDYDGASNMFGKNTDVSVQIAAEQAREFAKPWN